jgi:thiol:disulfide interchange protein
MASSGCYEQNEKIFNMVKHHRVVKAVKNGQVPSQEDMNDFASHINLAHISSGDNETWRNTVIQLYNRHHVDDNRVVRALEMTNNESLSIVLSGAILAKTLCIDHSIFIRFNPDGHIKVSLKEAFNPHRMNSGNGSNSNHQHHHHHHNNNNNNYKQYTQTGKPYKNKQTNQPLNMDQIKAIADTIRNMPATEQAQTQTQTQTQTQAPTSAEAPTPAEMQSAKNMIEGMLNKGSSSSGEKKDWAAEASDPK